MLHENKTFTEPKLLHLDLETSSICNFSCDFCPRPKENGTMPIEDIKRIIKEAADVGVETIKPFWRGEPLIDERMPEILKYAKECGLKTMLNSNGSWYNGKINKTNACSILDILRYTDWLSLSIDSQHNNYYVLADLSNVLMHKNEDTYIEIQASIYNSAVANICQKYNIPYKVDQPTKRSDTDNESEVITGERKYCGFPDWRLVVAWNGDCLPCCTMWGRSYTLGNVYEDSLTDIFNGDMANKLRENLKKNAFNSKECLNCVSRSAYVN